LGYVLIFQPHLTIRAKYILTNGSSTTTSKLLERNDFHFRHGPPFLGVRRPSDYVKEQGWATMPGEKGPDSRFAGEVADLLAELKL